MWLGRKTDAAALEGHPVPPYGDAASATEVIASTLAEAKPRTTTVSIAV
jgi:hypothetical protein